MIKEVKCNTAEEFLDLIYPLNRDRWSINKYIFRGVPNAEYPLLPGAYRDTGVFSPKKMWSHVGILNTARQVEYEIDVIKQFILACDASALAVPGDSPRLRNMLSAPDEYAHEPSSWPPPFAHQTIATAQHHGVPTCFLDWSSRSYVAAYFAASSAVKLAEFDTTPSHLAIWALNTELDVIWDLISIIKMPGNTSVNLAAQAGLFTAAKITTTAQQEFRAVSLDLYTELYEFEGVHESYPSLYKITLPYEEASKLLWLCEELGVKGSILFPGFEGVSREVNDYAFAKAHYGRFKREKT